MSSFFTCHAFLEVGKTQDLPSKIWQTLGDHLLYHESFFILFFTLPPVLATPMATGISAHISTHGEMSFAKLVCQTVGDQFFLLFCQN
jgi:hypothetical protein